MPRKSDIPPKIMAIARSMNYVTAPQLAATMNADINLVCVNLLRLEKKGMLVREGERKHYQYRIKK